MTAIATRLARSAPVYRVLAAVALAACSGPAARPAPVIVRADPASAAECPYGGTVVSSGFDGNGDGELQEAEATVRTPVCDPPSMLPPAIVLRILAEPYGSNCSAGGTAVQSGPDNNRNGTLDDAEVTRTDYLCRQGLITRFAAEPAGSNCREGGVAFFAGADRDDDGVLDDAEIESTEYACGDVVSRDVVIHSDAEATALAPIRVIAGGVTVQLTAIRTLSLPRLERIGGSLQVLDNPQLTRLALPVLEAVDGDVTLRASGLTAVDFARLRRAGSLDLELLSLPRLTGFPALAEVNGDVRISDMPALVSAELPPGSSAGDLSITANAALVHVAWDLTDRLGAVDIRDNPQLETIDLSMTALAGGAERVGPVEVTSNPLLGHLGLRAERVESFAIGVDPLLTDIQLLVTSFDRDVTLVDVEPPFNLMMRGHGGAMDIGGDLMISGPVTSFEAGDGIAVRGRFILDGTRLETIARFPSSLRAIGGLRVSNNARLTDLSAFAVLGDLEVIRNAELSSVNLAHILGDEMGAIVLGDNPKLARAPALETLGRVHGAVDIERNPLLAELFGPGLVRIEGTVRVHDNSGLTDLQFPKLALVGSSLEVSSNAALQTLVLPALPEVASALTIASNPQLHHIDLAALGHSDDFRVDDNPHLPTCEVLLVFDHTSGAHEQSGNDDAGTCGP